MATEYTKATVADFDELRDLANYVFKLDFEELLPKLYHSENATAPYHHIVKEDGRIKSVVGSFPMLLTVAGHPLKVAGIGTVSVHPYTRRKGYMKALMTRAMEEMAANGVDLACLGGARQRYAYFGFEPCGPLLSCELTQNNLKHTFGQLHNGELALTLVDQNDTATLTAMKTLHDAQPFRVERSDKLFYDILCSWKSLPYALTRGEEIVGYLVCSDSYDEVRELVLRDPADLADALGVYFELTAKRYTHVLCWPWNKPQVRFFESVAERISVVEDSCFAVLHYQEVVAAMMDLKAMTTTLADGAFTLCVEGRESIRIAVQGGKPEVTPWAGPCDVTLPPLKAMRLLFSPVTSVYDFECNLPAAAHQWLPLPLGYPKQDGV